MNAGARRTWRNSLFLVAASAAIISLHSRYRSVWTGMDYLTGWALVGVVAFLAIYNGRKKLPFLPLGSSEAWLQLHIYIGYLAAVLFLVHGKYRLPSGPFEIALAAVFAIVMASGVIGLTLSKQLPRRLSTRGGEVVFERIPAYHRAILERAEQLALDSTRQTGTTNLLEFYTANLRDHFRAKTRYVAQFFEDQRGVQGVLARIEDLKRFTNESENKILNEFANLIWDKDRLEYHAALQGILKGWLFVHIPFTLSLIVFTLAHIVLVFAFSTEAP
jgi:hypothetical protein